MLSPGLLSTPGSVSGSRAVLGTVIRTLDHVSLLGIGDLAEVNSLVEVLPYQAIGVLVVPTLSRAVGNANIGLRRHCLAYVTGELRASVHDGAPSPAQARLQKPDSGSWRQPRRGPGQPCRQQSAGSRYDVLPASPVTIATVSSSQ